ncbi:MAG TPA: PAS domain-containing protein, partial [Pararhizobium sp.]|nr:PAS domain-containing protein [Pararhizobium sp.]
MTHKEFGGDNEALLAASSEVESCGEPAYIKDSELRYLAVNEHFARLWSCEPSRLLGTRDEDWQASFGQGDRDEKERRSLVFGKDQTALFDDIEGRRYRIKIRREKTADGATFIIGKMKPAAGLQRRAAADGETAATQRATQPEAMEPEATQDSSSNAYRDLDLIKAIEAFDEPIAVVSRDGRMLFSNALYREAEGEASPEEAAPHRPSRPEAERIRPTFANDEMLALALDEVDAGIIIYDGNDMLQYANQRMKEMFAGLMPELTRGTPLRQVLETLYDKGALTLPGDAEQAEAGRERWVSDRIRLHHRPLHETVEQLSDGRWIKAITRRTANDVMIGVRLDITGIKQAEIDLRRKNDEVLLFKAVLDELPNSTYVKDENFRLTFANRAYGTLTGRNPDEIIGKTDVDLFGPEGEALVEADRVVLRTGEIAEQEEELTRLSGEKLALVSRKARVTTDDGRTFLIGSTLDITSHKQHEHELYEARREAETVRADIESVIDGLDMAVVVAGADDRI